MKYLKTFLLSLVAVAMTSWVVPVIAGAYTGASQGQSTALERGYRTGYSDGYNAGYKDIADHASRDYQNKDDYQHADRNYNEAWGPVEDYHSGYQQGFESGYAAGYDRHPFDSSIPTGLRQRGNVDSQATSAPADNTSQDTSTAAGQQQTGSVPSGSAISGSVVIPRDTNLLVELQSSLSSDVSQRGDRFEARVIEPREFEGAIVEGRVTRVTRAGKVKGTAELQLSFETIRMPDGRTTGFSALVVEVVDVGTRDGVGTVDSEGGVKGKNSTRDDISKVGASTGIGAIIGAIAGGGKGAAIGAAIGGAVGTGSVLTKRGNDVRLARGQQLRIRTATETRIQ
ncbi:MAG: hypothetical protein M3Y84_12075 [Acidobacteriota bacterium]|nr:hypothetical protein [Acidobacteriota bacterium]